MSSNYLAPINKCTYKKAQQQIKEETFQDGDFTQKAHQYLSSSDALENNNFHVLFYYDQNASLCVIIVMYEKAPRGVTSHESLIYFNVKAWV